MDVFMQLFQRNISQWINKLQTPYLCQNNAHYLVFHISQNIAIVKTFNVSKHKKSRIHFSKLKTWVWCTKLIKTNRPNMSVSYNLQQHTKILTKQRIPIQQILTEWIDLHWLVKRVNCRIAEIFETAYKLTNVVHELYSILLYYELVD